MNDAHLGTAAMLALVLAAGACSSGEDDADCAGADCDEVADGGAGGAPVLGGTCADEPPAGAEQAPDPPGYSGGACPVLTPGQDTANIIQSSGMDREFILLVPEDAGADEVLPIGFLWHWLSGDGSQIAGIAGGQQAANDERAILIAPTGIGQIPASWPWSTATEADPASLEIDLVLFDDILSCVSEQFNVNKNCVSSIGVSDGALWTSQLIGHRGSYFSSIIVISGGVGPDSLGLLMPYIPSAHKMPALALWGGETDNFAGVVEFDPAMQNLEAGLEGDGHFITECIHNCGHNVPPLDVAPGQTIVGALFDFVTDHPYWLEDGASPYLEDGLPEGMPAWCGVGVGSATPRTGDCSGGIGL